MSPRILLNVNAAARTRSAPASSDSQVTTNSRLHWARRAFYYVYIAFTMGAGAVLLIPTNESGGDASNTVFISAWIALHALSLIFFFTTSHHNAFNLLIAIGMGAFIVASALWSAEPFSTFVYGGMVAGNILTAYMLSRDFSAVQILNLILRIVLIFTAAALVLAFFEYGQIFYFDTHNRPTALGTQPIRGFFNHKVSAGLYASMAIVIALHMLRGWRRSGAILLLSVFVVLTGSSTGLVLLPIALLVYFFVRAFKSAKLTFPVAIILSIVTAVPIGGLILANFDRLLDVLGRDSTLTGRTILWDWGYMTWLQRPLLGWGFSGYLNGPDATAINTTVRQMQNYDVPHFHQSYLQTAVDLGVIGLLLLVVILLSIIRNSVRAIRSNDGAGVLTLSLTLVMIVSALAMFLFIQYNNFTTLLLMTLFFTLRTREPARTLTLNDQMIKVPRSRVSRRASH